MGYMILSLIGLVFTFLLVSLNWISFSYFCLFILPLALFGCATFSIEHLLIYSFVYQFLFFRIGFQSCIALWIVFHKSNLGNFCILFISVWVYSTPLFGHDVFC